MWQSIINLCLKFVDLDSQSSLQHLNFHVDFEKNAQNAVRHFSQTAK